MGKTLMIAEVSKKQDYIFHSNKLQDNILRSENIRWVTSRDFYKAVLGDAFSVEENLVNDGGGHIITQYESQEAARDAASQISKAVLCRYPDMEMFIRCIPYEEHKKPAENTKALTDALEQKKSLREASFRQVSFGIELLQSEADAGGEYAPCRVNQSARKDSPALSVQCPEGWSLTTDIGLIAGDSENFVAIVHMDGNAMGTRVHQLAGDIKDWEEYRSSLQAFSDGIDADFRTAMEEMMKEVADNLTNDADAQNRILPIRPIIQAGDDICFVCRGSIALECARIAMQKLKSKSNIMGGPAYASCAGIVMVHTKYPFHRAYTISEELCDSAKKYSKKLSEDASACCIDWHIEFGQLKDSLNQIRRTYIADDDTRMLLRPLFVETIETNLKTPSKADEFRTYKRFCDTSKELRSRLLENTQQMDDQNMRTARSKIKQMRDSIRQGKNALQEAMLRDNLSDICFVAHDIPSILETQNQSAIDRCYISYPVEDKDSSTDQKEHCVLFDAIEVMDHIRLFEEVHKH